MSGVLRSGVGTPRYSGGPRHSVGCPHHGVAEKEAFGSLGYAERRPALQRSSAMLFMHGDICVLLFRCSEDLFIGLMRTL